MGKLNCPTQPTAPEFAQATFALGAARGERCPYGLSQDEPGDSKARPKKRSIQV